MVTKQAIEQVTNAPYQREIDYVSPTAAALTTIEVPEALSNFIVATADQELFPWIRLNVKLAGADNSDVVYWYVIKCLSADSVQDMSDSSVLEALMKDSKIFKRGSVIVSWGAQATYDLRFAKVPEIELHNVKLKPNEELRLLLLPVRGQAINGLAAVLELEYRQTPTGA